MHHNTLRGLGPAIRINRKSPNNDFRRSILIEDKTGMIVDRRYWLKKIIGRGGFGTVYLAIDAMKKEKVALKIRDNRTSMLSFSEKRITSEINALSQVNHRNIVSMKGAGVCNGESYVVMEYLKGLDLEEYIQQEKMVPYPETAHIVAQICSGLGALHDKGIIHRDIKPHNVFLLQDGTVKIFDFDLSRFTGFEQSEPFELMSGTILGTISYLAPEIIKGSRPDHRADIYAVGVIMYKMLCGELPIVGEMPLHTITSILMKVPEPPSAKNPLVSDKTDRIVMRALEKDPDKRFASIMEMRDALFAFPSFMQNIRPLRIGIGPLGPDDPTIRMGQMTRSFGF